MKTKLHTLLLCAPLMLLLSACQTIAPYSQKSYENATSIKAEALDVLSKAADEDFDANKDKVDALKLDVEKAYEYSNGIPKNERIAQMWAILKDEKKKGTLFDVLNLWKEKHKLSSAFLNGVQDKDEHATNNVPGIKDKISQQFDQIIGLESGKNK